MLALLLLDCLVFGLLRSSKSPTLVRQLFFLCITALTRRLTTFLHAVTCTILGGCSPSQSYRLLRMAGVLSVILITIRPCASVSSVSMRRASLQRIASSGIQHHTYASLRYSSQSCPAFLYVRPLPANELRAILEIDINQIFCLTFKYTQHE